MSVDIIHHGLGISGSLSKTTWWTGHHIHKSSDKTLMGKVFTGAKQLLGEELFRDHHVLPVAFCCLRSSLKCTDDQVILTGMFTVIKGDIQNAKSLRATAK